MLEGERPVHDAQVVGPQLPVPGHPETDEPRHGCSGLLFPELSVV